MVEFEVGDSESGSPPIALRRLRIRLQFAVAVVVHEEAVEREAFLIRT